MIKSTTELFYSEEAPQIKNDLIPSIFLTGTQNNGLKLTQSRMR